MRYLGSVIEGVNSVLTINPYAGADVITITPTSDQFKFDVTWIEIPNVSRPLKAKIAHPVIATNKVRGDCTVYVKEDNRSIPYNNWVDSINNPFVLMRLEARVLRRNLLVMEALTSNFSADMTFNNLFMVRSVCPPQMWKAFVFELSEDFPDYKFTQTGPTELRVSTYNTR